MGAYLGPVPEISFDRPQSGLASRVLQGDVFIMRGALQSAGVMEQITEASFDAIQTTAGSAVVPLVKDAGFQHIHRFVDAKDIPKVTDAVYDSIRPIAHHILSKLTPLLFHGEKNLYFEETPNVRFHIPYGLTQGHRKAFKTFSKSHGEGKITAHGPHRDSWLDCPSNGINLWFAVGPVRRENGLTVYRTDYGGDFRYQESGDIADGEKLNPPLTFDLAPGDGVMFHTDHLHGSVLNRIDETRFVISFRLSFGKPVFPNRHFHRYVKADWIGSGLSALSHVPAMAQASYVRSTVRRAREKLSSTSKRDGDTRLALPIGTPGPDSTLMVPCSALPVGAIVAASETIVVARVAESKAVAVSRRCPHAGADFANGWISGKNIVCPWHNLPFDGETGRAACDGVASLVRYVCEIENNTIVIHTDRVIKMPAH